MAEHITKTRLRWIPKNQPVVIDTEKDANSRKNVNNSALTTDFSCFFDVELVVRIAPLDALRANGIGVRDVM